MTMKFRAHDTFFIRKGWLSKGMKYVQQNPCVFVDKEKNPIWVIYDRDFSDSRVAYKTDWDIEPRTDFPDIPSLVFGFRLKNDGRTIAEYCCDYWKQPRLLVPESVDKNLARKIWRH